MNSLVTDRLNGKEVLIANGGVNYRARPGVQTLPAASLGSRPADKAYIMQRTIVQPLKLDLSGPQLTQDDGQVSSSGDGSQSGGGYQSGSNSDDLKSRQMFHEEITL
ncbi:hypothetical protein K0M31_010004 [Melipona bicolor]|uniref:Uncharacterized protein n=1 Tax=Melipona bicolor TaxID=60889 RepID=A0AA40KIS8_9HYME|nr:hypothetical protein K0M31_010004 [Melipona bicolor]